MRKIFLLGTIILLSSIFVCSIIFAEKNTPEETVKRYWQYLLDKNCQKIDDLQTDFTGYRKDKNGQIYRVQLTATAAGMDLSKISNCYLADDIELFGSKYFKVLKSEVNEELKVADVRILTKDKRGIKHKYDFSLSKVPQGDVWKIIAFTRVLDEKDE